MTLSGNAPVAAAAAVFWQPAQALLKWQQTAMQGNMY
jgi:hypothetical protein